MEREQDVSVKQKEMYNEWERERERGDMRETSTKSHLIAQYSVNSLFISADHPIETRKLIRESERRGAEGYLIIKQIRERKYKTNKDNGEMLSN